MKTASDIGLYSSGQRIVQLLYVLPAILATSFFPTLSRFIGGSDKNKVRLLIEKGVTLSILIAVPLAVGGFVLGGNIINFVFGSEYAGATTAFKIMVLTILATFPGTIIGNYIIAYDKQKGLTFYILLGSLGNVIFNYLLIPIWGIAGAALATLLVQIIYNWLAFRLAKKANDFSLFKYSFKIILASIIMGLLGIGLNRLGLHVAPTVVASAIFYFLILYLLKEPLISDIKNIFLKRAMNSINP
jgi:O-antigen/teichoic acid export membrane protein